MSPNDDNSSIIAEQNSSLKGHVLSGFAWTSAAIVSVRLLTFLMTLILAKILAREVFAVIALANIVIGAIDLFSNFGFNRAIIQYRGDVRKAANVALTLRVGQGLFFFIAAIVFAGKFAEFYNTPVLRYVIPVLGINFVISAVWSIPMSLMDKELQFRKQLAAQTVPAALQFVTAISLALLDFGVWSIVAGVVVLNISQTIMFRIVSKVKLKFSFDWGVTKELLSFGLPIFASSFVWYVVNYSPNAVIGALFDADSLAAYSFAFTMISLPITEIIYKVLNRVLFPTYSKLSHDIGELKNGYLKSLKYIAIIIVPLSIGMPMFGGNLFTALYDDKWAAAVAPLQAFGVYAFMRSIAASTGSVFLALGKTKYLLHNALVCCTIIVVFIYPVSIKYGIVGVAALFSIAWTFTLGHLLYWMKRILDVGAIKLAKLCTVPLAVSISVMIPIKILGESYLNLNNIFILISFVIAIAALYLAAVSAIDKNFGRSLRQSILKRKLILE